MANMHDIKGKVTQLAKQIAEDDGFELFDVELLGRGRLLLKVIIDKDGGVTLDDCEDYSKRFGAALEVESFLTGSYTLEVSSPGLDRPLRGVTDFEKYRGRLARIVTKEKVDNRNFFVGRIGHVRQDSVTISMDEHEIAIPFEQISRARLEIEL